MYIISGTERACQKSYGFKNLVKLGRWQPTFKITLGTCVFKKSCSTSSFAGMGALFFKKTCSKNYEQKIKRNVVLQPKLKSCSKS